jgi:hypothetical protein
MKDNIGNYIGDDIYVAVLIIKVYQKWRNKSRSPFADKFWLVWSKSLAIKRGRRENN